MEKYLNKLDAISELLDDDKILLVKDKLQELKNIIIYDMAYKNGNKTKKQQLTAAKALLVSAQKDKTRTFTHKPYVVDDSYQICNGYVGIVLKEPINGLEYNSEKANYFDCRNIIFSKYKNDFRYDYNYEKVEIDLLELEQKSITAKRVKDLPLPDEVLGHQFKTYYNPIYLLNTIKVLGSENVEIYFHKSGSAEIYLTSDLGDAVVLPIKMEDTINKV